MRLDRENGSYTVHLTGWDPTTGASFLVDSSHDFDTTLLTTTGTRPYPIVEVCSSLVG